MIQAPIFPQGTRVRVGRGRFPMDPALVGRTGLVVQVDDYRPERFGVVLDGEEEIRDFARDELEVVERAGELEERADTGPTVGP
ncbi:MAG TPA: hypothetical protein VLL48_06610 [Longimicrobiales bacterium]|nr:hypothetical protein [Longimicrobiales bacterium]